MAVTGGFQIEQAALVKDHGHAVVATTLVSEARSKRLAVVTSGDSRIVGEAAEGLAGDEFSAEGDRERAGREGAGGNGRFQDAESIAKPIVLRNEIAHQEGKTRLSIGQRQVQGCFVN